MIPSVTNLLPTGSGTPSGGAAEEVTVLLQTSALRLEHLASHGQASPPGFWYEQPESEWVLLLRGAATLDFGDDGALDLRAGGAILIPAHARHRVENVSQDALWLALHFKEDSAS